jgi:ribosomal protein S18 acetylase RimI-like enzyme
MHPRDSEGSSLGGEACAPTAAGASVEIHPVLSPELDRGVGTLARLLQEAVDAGAGLGMLAPLSHDEARDHWLSLRTELRAGSRVLLVAQAGRHIVGTGQLQLSVTPASRHTAELQKLIVTAAARGRGIGRSLVAALHAEAYRRRRWLLTLGTRRGGGAEAFYQSLGYREVGMIPDYAVDAAGVRHDRVLLYRDLSGNQAAHAEEMNPTARSVRAATQESGR